ncbi:MAG: response regulator [Elusimicrobia bacterium]|nr:response regulator [Elusimicrobiota bacterium]MBP9698483.1 response regulator [Elusimicrobiota bacterium]
MDEQTPFDAVPARDRMGLPLRSLTADVAHELSNQLGCLVLLPDLMMNSLSPDSPLAKDLNQIRRAAHRIDELATHLSLLSQDSNEREIVNLNRAAQHTLDDESLTALLKEGGGTVMSRWNEQVCPVLGSTDWVALVAGILVRNALDAKPGGCATLSTETRVITDVMDGWEPIPAGSYAVLTASDDGPPLSALQKEKLFEPYFTHSLGRKSTSGLGLAVVRQLARRMGAFIHVRSIETGNRVDIYFPTAGAPHPAAPPSTVRDRVLVVDDREEQRTVISRLLRRFGYRVASVCGGSETVAYLETNGAELVVMDISLRRDREGLDLHRDIRTRWPDIKVLLMSGHPREVYADVLGRAGDCPFLKKPFRSEELFAAVDALLPAPLRPE